MQSLSGRPPAAIESAWLSHCRQILVDTNGMSDAEPHLESRKRCTERTEAGEDCLGTSASRADQQTEIDELNRFVHRPLMLFRGFSRARIHDAGAGLGIKISRAGFEPVVLSAYPPSSSRCHSHAKTRALQSATESGLTHSGTASPPEELDLPTNVALLTVATRDSAQAMRGRPMAAHHLQSARLRLSATFRSRAGVESLSGGTSAVPRWKAPAKCSGCDMASIADVGAPSFGVGLSELASSAETKAFFVGEGQSRT
jgi:hypothetical protein